MAALAKPLELAAAGAASAPQFLPHATCKTPAAPCEYGNPGDQPNLAYSPALPHCWVLQAKSRLSFPIESKLQFVSSFLHSTTAGEMEINCRVTLRAGAATTSTAEMGQRRD